MLTRGAATEVVAADNDGVLRFGLVWFDESRGVGGREADQGVGSELFVLGRVRGDEGEVLGGDDLVSVDVVADDVAEAVEAGFGGGGGGSGDGAWNDGGG